MKKIMFNDEYGLTQAVLDGKKTMTRRDELNTEKTIGFVSRLNWLKDENYKLLFDEINTFNIYTKENELLESHKCRYKVGEVVAIAQSYENAILEVDSNSNKFHNIYNMLKSKSKGNRNKMFVRAYLMPHKIQITGIRLEMLQDISEEDCLREGIKKDFESAQHNNPRKAFATLIDKVASKGTWESNPYVFVYQFELIK